MRNLLYISVFLTGVFVLTLLFSHTSFAQGCVVTGATPSGGEVVNCSGTDPNGITTTNQGDDVTVEQDADITRDNTDTIDLLSGDNYILIKGGLITNTGTSGDAVSLSESGDTGNNELVMKGGTLIGGCAGIEADGDGLHKITIEDGFIQGLTDEGIDLGDGPNEVYIMGGTILGTDAALQTGSLDDKIIITGGFLKQDDNSDPTIKAGPGNDLISVSHATIDGSMTTEGAMRCGSGDDTVKLGTGAVILNTIYADFEGSTEDNGFDTLVFEMEVPAESIDFICSQILAQNPQDGSITINDLFYEWEDFDVLVCDLQPVRVVRPIPTLSEWGLIAMAGVLGIIGLLALRRRKVTA